MANNNLPPVDMSTFRPLGETSTTSQTAPAGLPPVDMSTFKPLGEVSATPQAPVAKNQIPEGVTFGSPQGPPEGVTFGEPVKAPANAPSILSTAAWSPDQPLTSYGAATRAGVGGLVRDTYSAAKGAVTGTLDLFSAPKDDTEKIVAGISPVALPLYRTLRGAGHSVKDAAQITGAIHDINNSADPAGTYAKVAQQTASQGAGQALTALAAEGIIKAVPKVAEGVAGTTKSVSKAIGPKSINPKVIQEPLQSGIRSAIEDVADDAGVAKPKSQSMRNVVEETADQIYAKSKAQYQALDEATGGRFQRFKEKLEAGRKQLMNLSGSEEDVAKEASILKGQQETEAAMQEAFNDAKAKGVDPQLIDEANKNFKRSQALYDLDVAVKKSSTGAHPDLSTDELNADSPETVDPRKLHARVNSLYDSGRLQEALGEKGANDLFDHTLENAAAQTKILRNRKIAMTAGKYGAGALGLTALGSHFVGHLLD